MAPKKKPKVDSHGVLHGDQAAKAGYARVDKSSHPVQKAGQRSPSRAGSKGWISASQGGTAKAGFKGEKTTGIEKKLAKAGYGENKQGRWTQVSAAYGGYDNSKKTARLLQKAENKGVTVGSKREQAANAMTYAGKKGTINLETGAIRKYDPKDDPFKNFGNHDAGTVSRERLAKLREKAHYTGPTAEARATESPRVGGGYSDVGGKPTETGGYTSVESGPMGGTSPKVYAEPSIARTGYGAQYGKGYGKGEAGYYSGATGSDTPVEPTSPEKATGPKGGRGGRGGKGKHRGGHRGPKGHGGRGRQHARGKGKRK